MKKNPPDDKGKKVYRPEEEIERWKNQYEAVKKPNYAKNRNLNSSNKAGGSGGENSFDDRRIEPRFHFMPESKIFAHMGPQAFPVINIAIGGLAFHSDVYFEPGTKLLMSALGMIALEVEVLSSDMEETDADLMEVKYRVRAKFGTHVNGYQVYVLAREMHIQNTKGIKANLLKEEKVLVGKQ